MLRKFLLIGVFTLCATLYAYGPEWSSVSAQTDNQSVPDVSDIGSATPLEGILSDLPPGNFTPGAPLVLNVDYTNDTDNLLEVPTLSVSLPAGVAPTENSLWQEAGDGPDGTIIYTLSPEDAPDDLGNIPPGFTISVPLPVDVAETVGSDPIVVNTRLDVFDGSQEQGNRLSAILGTLEVLPTFEIPEDIITSLTNTSAPTTTEEIQFVEPTQDSPSPTINSDTGAVVLPIEFTNTSGDTLDNTVLIVEIPEGTEVPSDSGWQVETITDADGNETQVAVLNVGSLDPNQSITVPFPLLGNNVQVGDTLTAPTLLTANDGAVQLRGEVAATLEEVLVPTNLTVTNEPANTSALYLPIIRQ